MEPPSPDHIKRSLDLGTSKCTWAYVFCDKDGKHIGKPRMLRVEGFGREIPSIGTWLPNGRFVFGHELAKLEHRNRELSGQVISFFKLGLYQGAGTHKRRDQLMKQLESFRGGRTLFELYEATFRALVDIFDKAIIIEARNRYPDETIAKLPCKTYVSRPQVFDPQARRTMQLAAKQAGLEFVFLASEPHNVLAYLVDYMVSNSLNFQQQLGKDGVIVVADLGSGTADNLKYKCTEPLSKDSQVEAVKEESGTACGAAEIDELILEHMCRDKSQTAQDLAKMHGYSMDAFRRNALVEIERAKRDFPKRCDVIISVCGQDGAPDFLGKLSYAHFKQAFDTVIANVIESLDRLLGDDLPSIMNITGGFSKSGYVMDKLRARYEPMKIKVMRPNEDDEECHAVAVGALLRHPNIQTCSLPSTYGYALLRDETFDVEWHPDCFTYGKNQRVDYKKGLAVPHDLDSCERIHVVYDRLHILIKRGEVLKGLRDEHTWDMIFNDVDSADPVVSATFVCLTKDFNDHAAGRDGDGNYHDGVLPWTKAEVTLDKKELQRRHCPTRFEVVSGMVKGYWRAELELALRVMGDEDIEVGFRMKPGQHGKQRLGIAEDRKMTDQQEVALHALEEQESEEFGEYVEWDPLWSSRFSEFGAAKDSADPMDLD